MALNCLDDQIYISQQYRLRAGTPMPVEGSNNFKYHTFMAEKYEVWNYLATQTLPRSSDFRGQGGNLTSASFSRVSDNTGKIFSGRKVFSPTIIEEDSY
jgi:hypothetical protein